MSDPRPRLCRRPTPARRASRAAALLFAVCGAFAPASAGSASRWTAEAALGNAWNLPLPVMVTQDKQPDVKFRGHWKTRGFEGPIYYSLRAGIEDSTGVWMLELIHHKILLDNLTPEVQHFEVSHGYNLLVLERLRRREWWHVGAGLGVVVAHPENRVRDQPLDQGRGMFGLGYYLTGPAVSLMAGARQPIRSGLQGFAELKITGAYARLPVADGWSSVPNVAAHVTIGLGWSARAAASSPE
jgi:hypothetical protein